MSGISGRKEDHINLAIRGDVGFRAKSTLLECVELIHNSLPELAVDEIDLSCRVFGKRLRAPLLITGMTGGTERAGNINRALAKVAEECGVAFGVGSQRPMLTDPAVAVSYQVRDVAPTALILGNLGVVQASEMTTPAVQSLVDGIGADALCVHLNPAQEMAQPGGDRNFRGGEATFARLITGLSVPVIAKETGCGVAPGVARRLQALGVRDIDVSGAGGTSWVAVETHRATADQKRLGERFWDWGLPTAVCTALLGPLGLRTLIASGGVDNGLDAARAIALGAHVVGMARPVIQAWDAGGEPAVKSLLSAVEQELRTAMCLVGAKDLHALRGAPRVIGEPLGSWLRQLSS